MSLGRSLLISAIAVGLSVGSGAAAQSADLLSLTELQKERLGVATALLREAERAARAELPARIVPSRDGSRPVVAPFAGVVEQVFAMPGADIRSGQPIASILSRDYQENLSGLEQARAEAGLAGAETDRQRKLHDGGLISRSELDLSEARRRTAEAVLLEHERISRSALPVEDSRSGAYMLRAPVTGRVSSVSVTAGETLDAMSPVATIALDGSLWAEIQVPARLIGQISAGDVVEFGPDLTGEILSAGNALDPRTRAATAVTTVPESAGVRLGDIVRVRIAGELPEGAVLEAPASSVIPVDGKLIVFIATKTGFKAAAVKILARTSDTVTLVGEIEAGENVATSGLTELKAMLLAGAR